MIKFRRGFLPWLCLLCGLIFPLLYITTVRSSFLTNGPPKRGYILDREGNPLVISKNFYCVYLLLKGRSLVGDDLSPEVRKYLPQGVNLPKKGVILLADGLNAEDIQALKKDDKVLLEWTFERKIIYPEIEALVGRCSGHEGLTGLEKAFDESLRKGQAVRTSLSASVIKKLAQLGGRLQELEEILLFNRRGELLGYYSRKPHPFFLTFILIPSELLPLDFASLEWELGKAEAKREGNNWRITPLHLIQAEVKRVSGANSFLTILPKDVKEEKDEAVEFKEERLFLPSQGKLIYLLSGGEKIALVVAESTTKLNLLSLLRENGLLQ